MTILYGNLGNTFDGGKKTTPIIVVTSNKNGANQLLGTDVFWGTGVTANGAGVPLRQDTYAFNRKSPKVADMVNLRITWQLTPQGLYTQQACRMNIEEVISLLYIYIFNA